jgi:ABC-2 type transport system ATP-binding protein
MWQLVKRLREGGVTIILTTHYIEEAQEIADRIGIIDRGRLMLVEEKDTLMRKLGGKHLSIELREPIGEIPASLAAWNLQLSERGDELVYEYDDETNHGGIARLLAAVEAAGIGFADISTRQTSLEDIFVSLIGDGR